MSTSNQTRNHFGNRSINNSYISGTQRPESRRNTHQYTQPQSRPLIFRQEAEWSKLAEVSIRLTQLQPSTTTYDIYRNFKQFGTIVLIEIFEGRNGTRDGSGKIKFSPPPHTAFWEDVNKFGNFPIQEEDGANSYNCRIERMRSHNRGPNKVQSPLKPHVYYDATMKLIPTRLHFGTLVKHNILAAMHTISTAPKEELTFVIDMAKRRITSTFDVAFKDPRAGMYPVSNVEPGEEIYPVGKLDRVNRFMFQIPFAYLKTIYRVDLLDNLTALVIPLDNPPQFYRKRWDEAATHSAENLIWTEFDTWYRQTDIVYNPYLLARTPLSLHKGRHVIDIGITFCSLKGGNKLMSTGRWATYSFVFNTKQNSAQEYQNIKAALADHNIEIETLENFDTIVPPKAKVWSLIDQPNLAEHELHSLNRGERSTLLPFEVRYQLEVCISRDILNEYNLSDQFVAKLAEMSSDDPSKARNILEYVADQGKRIYEPMTIFEDVEALSYSSKTDIPHYCAYTRKATVTPTTVYFSTPTVETTNRVLRRYSRENADGRFLRVQFTDELSEVHTPIQVFKLFMLTI